MKKVFFYTDVLPFLSREGDAIEKLKLNLKTFKDCSDKITLIWHPWTRTEEFMELNSCPVTGDYQAIVEDYKNEGWGIFDEAATMEDAKKVMLECNGFYGDAGDLLYCAKEAGVPAMLRNIDIKE